jgi:hypothetical protein
MGDISDEELFDAQTIVESELASLAAERATMHDLKALRTAIEDMEASRTDQARIEADLAFHEAIFQPSGNRVCRLIFTVIDRAILLSTSKIVTRISVKQPLSYHKAIYQAIHRRNPEEARRQMTEHLLDAKSLLATSPPAQIRHSDRTDLAIKSPTSEAVKELPSSTCDSGLLAALCGSQTVSTPDEGAQNLLTLGKHATSYFLGAKWSALSRYFRAVTSEFRAKTCFFA